MDSQTLINVLFAACGALGGFVLKAMWSNLSSLQTADKELAEKVSSIEILVAAEYIKRNEFERLSSAIFVKLDRIEDKLDGKQDKV